MFVSMRLAVPVVRIPRRGLRNRHHETAVLHALQSDQATGELLDLPGFPVDDQDSRQES